MNLTPTIKKTFFALVMGIFLIYAIGGAAIASATISGHQSVVPGVVNVMVSLGMTWLMVFGIPCMVLVSYYVYDALYTWLGELSESAADALREMRARKNRKHIEHFERLNLDKDEAQPGYSSEADLPFKELME